MAEAPQTKAQLLAAFAGGGQPLITAQQMRDLVESVSPSIGSLFVSAPAATAGMAADAWVKAAGGTTAITAKRFTHANNRLTYVGVPRVHVHLAASCSFTTSGSGNTVSLGLAKNGVMLDGHVLREVGEGSSVGSTAVHGDTLLDTGDFIELWLKTNQATAGRSVTLEAAYLFAMGMLV